MGLVAGGKVVVKINGISYTADEQTIKYFNRIQLCGGGGACDKSRVQ